MEMARGLEVEEEFGQYLHGEDHKNAPAGAVEEERRSTAMESNGELCSQAATSCRHRMAASVREKIRLHDTISSAAPALRTL